MTMNIFKQQIEEKMSEVISLMNNLDQDSLIDQINSIKLLLHRISPFNQEPVDCVIWVKSESVKANDYNPNSVAPTEMKLLHTSIKEDGYTQPVVTFLNVNAREVVDGFHRTRVGKEYKDINKRVFDYLPVVTINESRTGKDDRIAATIRHNRARGKHGVDSMSQIVVDLKKRNWSDEKISRELGMDADEVLRLAQITGLAEAFKNEEFSFAWEPQNIDG